MLPGTAPDLKVFARKSLIRPCPIHPRDLAASQRRMLDQRAYLLRLLDAVFAIDSRIRSASIYEDQYLIGGGMRPGVTSYEPDEVAKQIDLEFSTIARTAAGWERWFGKMGAVYISYEKVNLYFFRLGGRRFMVVSAEPSLPPEQVIRAVAEAIVSAG
jgi:hypothetical protein